MFRCNKIHKYLTLILTLGFTSWLTVGGNALADNIRPAYLEIEESEAGAIRVVWKVPLNQGLPENFMPSFPAHFRLSSPRQQIRTGGAIIEKWDMVCGEGGIAGAQIRIDGLKQTTTDALVRIQLADGSIHRVVLRPTETTTTIPDAQGTTGEQKSTFSSLLKFIDHWRYLLLFLVAFVVSLLPGARRRGIVLCAVALVAGALSGHALARLPAYDKILNQGLPSTAEAGRVLQGLMLNTYRAFMLQEDEYIYDVLARSVSGEFLSEVYLENREKMQMSASGGGMAIVNRLDIKTIDSIKRDKNGNIAIVASWDVYGSVHHQKHIHYRCNTYKAELRLVPADDYWKLTSIQLLDQQRII
jgi:hypothetical protein